MFNAKKVDDDASTDDDDNGFPGTNDDDDNPHKSQAKQETMQYLVNYIGIPIVYSILSTIAFWVFACPCLQTDTVDRFCVLNSCRQALKYVGVFFIIGPLVIASLSVVLAAAYFFRKGEATLGSYILTVTLVTFGYEGLWALKNFLPSGISLRVYTCGMCIFDMGKWFLEYDEMYQLPDTRKFVYGVRCCFAVDVRLAGKSLYDDDMYDDEDDDDEGNEEEGGEVEGRQGAGQAKIEDGMMVEP